MSRGHAFRDVLRTYTMEQVHALEEAAHRNEAFDLVEMATAFRMAGHPKNSAWKNYVGHLKARTKKGRAREKMAVASKAQVIQLKQLFSRKA